MLTVTASGVVGREHIPKLFYVFLSSGIKVKISLKTDSNMSLKC